MSAYRMKKERELRVYDIYANGQFKGELSQSRRIRKGYTWHKIVTLHDGSWRWAGGNEHHWFWNTRTFPTYLARLLRLDVSQIELRKKDKKAR